MIASGFAPFRLREGVPVAIEPVDPIPTATGRRIGVRQFLWRFPDKNGAALAVPLVAAFMRKAGLLDFVLIESGPNDPRISGKGFVHFAQQELPFDGICSSPRVTYPRIRSMSFVGV